MRRKFRIYFRNGDVWCRLVTPKLAYFYYDTEAILRDGITGNMYKVFKRDFNLNVV